MQEISFLWEHFKIHADQRIKAFNFFIVLSIFADSGSITALAKESHNLILILLGLFIILLSCIFWVLDSRSHSLVRLSYKGIIKYEKSLPICSRLFTKDSKRKKGIFRYTFAFSALFIIQILFGLLVAVIGGSRLLC
jgi:hypothetical protein